MICRYDFLCFHRDWSCTADGSRGSAAILNVCPYNFTTLQAEDNLDRLMEAADPIEWDVIGSCDTDRKGERLSESKGGYRMHEKDKREDNLCAKGLAFLIHPKTTNCVSDFKTYSDIVIEMKVNLQG